MNEVSYELAKIPAAGRSGCVFDLPITPEEVVRALGDADGAQ